MLIPFRLRFLLLVVVCIGFTGLAIVRAQQLPSHAFLLAMCEVSDGCSRWDFQGKEGSGRWGHGAVANLTIERFDANDGGTIIIQRADTTGSDVGIKGTYTGIRKGLMIEGKLTWTWPGHPSGETEFRAVLMRNFMNIPETTRGKTVAVPAQLTVCEDVDGCSTWAMKGNQGSGTWNDKAVADLTVEHFEDSLVVIRRTDTTGAAKGLFGLYVGAFVDGRIDGVATLSWPGHAPDGVTAWQATIPVPPPPPPPTLSIDQLVDVVLPAPPEPKLPVPPAAPWQGKKDVAAFDLSGIWQRVGAPPDHPEKISALQLRDRIAITHLEGRQLYPANAPLGQAVYTEPAAATGTFNDAQPEVPQIAESNVKFTVKDANHFQVEFELLPAQHYVRVSSIPVQDVACEVGNPHHISADSALQRADLSLREKDLAAANCWYYVSALQGNMDALAEYAKSTYDGRGVAQNQALAVAWIQKAAMAGSPQASGYLSALFGTGSVVPHSKQRRDYWLGRYDGTSPHLSHNLQGYYLRNWMTQTVKPCTVGNPGHVNAGDALDMGRIAYEARSFQLAHCWLRISAEQGNMKAWTYLGLMSAFGMGIQQDLKNAFGYMYHAAKEKDVYAMLYLANFYRYGLGVAANNGQASEIMNAATNRPDGLDAFMHVEGTYKSPSDALSITTNIFEATVVADLECPETGGYYKTIGNTKVWEPRSRPPNCKTPKSDEIMNRVDINSHPTISSPEEIYPETPFREF